MSQNDDLISRQAAIEAMEDVDWYHIGKDGQLVHGANSKEDEPLHKAEDVYKVLEQLPSAQPLRMKGRWIDVTKTGGAELWKCSECGELELEDSYFCPNCGADMRGEQDG